MRLEKTLGLLVGSLFCWTCLSAQTTATTVMQGPSTFLLATFQPGDQVSVQVRTSSCDPNESGENSPLCYKHRLAIS